MNELVKLGEIICEMVVNYLWKNVLICFLGMFGIVEVDVINYEWLFNDYLLLCLDGLINMVFEIKILEILEMLDFLEFKLS